MNQDTLQSFSIENTCFGAQQTSIQIPVLPLKFLKPHFPFYEIRMLLLSKGCSKNERYCWFIARYMGRHSINCSCYGWVCAILILALNTDFNHDTKIPVVKDIFWHWYQTSKNVCHCCVLHLSADWQIHLDHVPVFMWTMYLNWNFWISLKDMPLLPSAGLL